MKSSQKGFGTVGLLIVVAVITLLGVAGWLVYDRRNTDVTSQQNTQNNEQKAEEPKKDVKRPGSYTFKELGISMDILDGWEVKSSPHQTEGVNFYSWTVQKDGVDDTIELRSAGFRGGFIGCEGAGSLMAVKVLDIAPTQNTKLMFMSWSFDSEGKTMNSTGIVSTEEKLFTTTNDSSATRVANKDAKPGNYFLCLGEPTPGFSLGLNSEPAPSFSRKDSIYASSRNGSGAEDAQFSSSAQSNADVKTMLTSIR